MKTHRLAIGAWILLACAAFCISQAKPAAPSSDSSPAGAQQSAPDDPPEWKPGRGMTPPRAIESPQPSYTDRARKAKHQGTCVLALIVGTDGLPHDITVVRPLGMGLDEKSIEAVQKWKFEPARKDGQPVAVRIKVETSFRIR